MAQILGEPGRNAVEESVKRSKNHFLAALLGIAALGILGGYALSAIAPIRGLPLWATLAVFVLSLVLTWLIQRWAFQRMDLAERERAVWRKGAGGEVVVAEILQHLPDSYFVINDITKRFGNIDHVVLGPTGLFVIDTKNWIGTVKADASGELLWNGKKPSKPAIKRMLQAVMDFQGKVKALTEKEHFVRGLMAFPTAYLEASFGSTRHIHCVRGDRLVQYIQDQTFSKGLNSEDIGRIKKAVMQLAGMDDRFSSLTGQNSKVIS